MKKLVFKLTFDEMCCLRDWIIKRCDKLNNKPEILLSATVAIDFAIKLSRKLLFVFIGKRRLSINANTALAIFILSEGYTNLFSALETAIVLPIVIETHQNFIA